jgi:hypothetical protein
MQPSAIAEGFLIESQSSPLPENRFYFVGSKSASYPKRLTKLSFAGRQADCRRLPMKEPRTLQYPFWPPSGRALVFFTAFDLNPVAK